MFPAGFFAKTFFAGSFFPPAGEGSFITAADGSIYRIVMRVRRRR